MIPCRIGTVILHLYIGFHQHVYQDATPFTQSVHTYLVLGLSTSDGTVVGGTGIILELTTILFKLSLDLWREVPPERLYIQWVNVGICVCHDDYTVTHPSCIVNPNVGLSGEKNFRAKNFQQVLTDFVARFLTPNGSCNPVRPCRQFFYIKYLQFQGTSFRHTHFLKSWF